MLPSAASRTQRGPTVDINRSVGHKLTVFVVQPNLHYRVNN